MVKTDLTFRDGQYDVLVQPDGKSLSFGVADESGVVLRHGIDGALDPTFGVGGIVRNTPPNGFLSDAVLQPDGKIVAIGADPTYLDMVVVRYLPSGAPDLTFGSGGMVQTDLGNREQANGVVLQPDGKIVVAGTTGNRAFVVRYLGNGTLDPSFGTGGTTTTSLGTYTAATSVGILSTGAIVVGGVVVPEPTAGPSMLLARYTPGGMLDMTYGLGGYVAPAERRIDIVRSLVVQSADRVVVAGGALEDPPRTQGVARYLPSGSLDPSFGTAGATFLRLGTFSGIVDLTVDGAGRLVMGGSVVNSTMSFESGFPHVAVSRFSPDGVTDIAFGCAGSTQLEIASGGGRGVAVAVAPDGRILVGGTAFSGPTLDLPGRSDFLLVRLHGTATTPAGYSITRSDGGVSPFGAAAGCGTLRGFRLNRPIVGHAARPSGEGYWLVGSDGGIFAFGDAPFLGSTGGMPLNRPVVGMASTPSGGGYWLVASDGGIFAFGNAGFFGSTGSLVLNRPVVGMAATESGAGYWLAGADGGIFTFGNAPFLGSTGGQPFMAPAVAIT